MNALNFNGSGSLLISGSDDYRVCIWDWVKSSVILQYESGHKSNVFQTKFVPFSGDTQIVSCARDGQVRLGLISSSGTFLGTKRVAKHADSCHKVFVFLLKIYRGVAWAKFLDMINIWSNIFEKNRQRFFYENDIN